MALAEDFQPIVDSLPPDWTQLELDLRIDDEERYIEAATLLTQINAMPYSKHDWHWRLRFAHEFGHAAAPETVHGTLALLDEQGIAGELRAARGALRPRGGRRRCGAGPSRCARSSAAAGPVARGARGAALPDLLFGSKVEGALRAAGHEVRARRATRARCWSIDLDRGRGPATGSGGARGAHVGFYPHVEQDTRRRAEEAGFDLVVPRSRMAREAAALVEGLLVGVRLAVVTGASSGIGEATARRLARRRLARAAGGAPRGPAARRWRPSSATRERWRPT